jgi:hypothetical protein
MVQQNHEPPNDPPPNRQTSQLCRTRAWTFDQGKPERDQDCQDGIGQDHASDNVH